MLTVTKRDGSKQPFDSEKINAVIKFACQGYERKVSVSAIAMAAKISLSDGMKTDDIHKALIKAAADKINQLNPEYAIVAAKLALYRIRKLAFGQYDYPDFSAHVRNLSAKGIYDAEIQQKWTAEEIAELGAYIKPERDDLFQYAAVSQLESKYLVQNRVTKELYEAPQQAYMLISMCLFQDWKYDRMGIVKEFYDAVSTFEISLPTPIMAGVRTPTRQYSSCVVIESGDSLDSINATTSAIVKYVSQRAGIGIGASNIRALGSEIRNGEAFHTGCIPFYKMFQAAVKSCSQGGVRGGAATITYPIWHLEIEDLVVLKNNRGTEDNRVRHVDYSVAISRLFYERLIKGADITLFSPGDVPDLLDAFSRDQAKFVELYEKYEQDPSIRKKTISATNLFSLIMQERAGTGRLYIFNIDHCNTHSSFDPAVAPVKQSNLCQEITLPTKPLNHIFDEEGEIALCTLAAFNLGALSDLKRLERLSYLLVAALDNLFDYQNYPVKAAEVGTKARRSLGVGVVNLAYYLAKNGRRYSDGSGLPLVHETFEAIQFYLLKASNELAKTKGKCEWFEETKYAKGLLPIDHYAKAVDSICSHELKLDWEWLRGEIKAHGLRNSALTALMPSETSSQISNATNGIEPPRGLVSVKSSKDGMIKQVVPDVASLSWQYELLWEMPSNKGYLEIVAVIQKFVDQAISANTNYDPRAFGGAVPMQQLLRDLLTAYRLGIKTLYYHNTRDGAGEVDSDGSKDSDCDGGCKI